MTIRKKTTKKVAKKVAKKATVKKAAVKKVATNKTPKKQAVKKAATTKTTAGKTTKPAAAKKKATVVDTLPRPPQNRPSSIAQHRPSGPPKPGKKLRTRELDRYKKMLLAIRDRLTGQIAALKNDSLKRTDNVNPMEEGTDAFDRQFALNLVSTEHHSLFEIDEALRRIAERTYGICEECTGGIEKARLQALPSVRMCISCKSEQERGKAKFRTL